MNLSKMSAQQFATLCHHNGPQLTLDVRSPSEVASEGVGFSHNLPLQDIERESLVELMAENRCGSDQVVYLLCQGGQRASMAAEKVRPLLSNPLVIIDGGINELRNTELPLVSTGAKTMSMERQVRITAGALVLLGASLGYFTNPAFYSLSAFVGAGLVFAGISDTCAMGVLLARMPWNNRRT